MSVQRPEFAKPSYNLNPDDSKQWHRTGFVAFRLFSELRDGERNGAGCDGHSRRSELFAETMVAKLGRAAEFSGCHFRFVSVCSLGNIQNQVKIPWGISFNLSLECPKYGPATFSFVPEKLIIVQTNGQKKEIRSIKYDLRTDFETLASDLRHPGRFVSVTVIHCPEIADIA